MGGIGDFIVNSLRSVGLYKPTEVATKNTDTTKNTSVVIPKKELNKKKSSAAIPIEKKDIQYNNGAVNKEKILGQQKNKPLFIKSYYGYNFLSPYIKCFIDNKLYNQGSASSLQKENYQKKFFDIPYNMLKSLDLEFEGASASGVTGKLTIKIQDGSGVVGTLLISTFYAMGSLQNNDGVPRVSVEFGWAPKGRNKLKKELEKLLLTKNQYSSFLIQDIQLEFDDKYKQEITITAIQDTTGVYESTSLKESQYKPFVVLGSQPSISLRLIQYWYYFNKNQSILETILPTKFPGLVTSELSSIISNIRDFFLKINSDVSTIKINKKDFLISNSNTYQLDSSKKQITNTKSFFNKLDNSKKESEIIKSKFNQFLERSRFHPYVIFSYVLNQFVTTIKSLQDDIPIYILRYYDESKIIEYNQSVFLNISGNEISPDEYCSTDVNLGTEKKSKIITYITNEFKVKENDTWEDLLNRIGAFVKINSGQTDSKLLTSQLYLNVRKYVKDIGDLTVEGSTGVKTNLKQNLIKKFEVLLEIYQNKQNKDGVDKIQTFIDFIKKQEKDFIYIVVTSGSQFLTDDNFKEKVIAQTYTVFPKISPDNRLQYQNFNSGSLDMSKESYADVIYFKPKLPFKEMLASNLSKSEDLIYNNGAFTFTYKKIGVVFLDETEKAKGNNQKQLINLIKKLDDFITKKDTETVTISNKKSGGVFTVNGFDSIYLQHSNTVENNISNFTSTDKNHKKIISSLKTDLEGYLTTWKNGYHYSTLLNIIKKNSNVFIGDNNSIDYENYIFNANEYNKYLNKMSLNFEAELKILGEPAFSYDFGQMLHIFLNVNNYDGTINVLLTGLYSVNKIKHEISESGSFTTTLTLRYDSPFSSKKDENNPADSKQTEVVNNGQ